MGMGPPPDAGGRQNPLGNMNEEDRSAMRATAQARGGLPGGGGQFGDMSEEQRSAMRATAEASGMALEGSRGPANASNGQLTMLAAHVVELLAARAAE